MNPIYALAKLCPKTLLPSGEGFGGKGFDKMEIAAAMAGLDKNAQMAAMCIWMLDNALTLDLAEALESQLKSESVGEGLKLTTKLNLANWAVNEFKYPTTKLNKSSGERELVQLSNSELARRAGIARQSFSDSHGEYYDHLVITLSAWLDIAYSHIKRQLTEAA